MDKKLVLFLLLVVLFSQKNAISQDFLEVKYSINDIIRQRENFKNEKINFITAKTPFGESEYEIYPDGNIINMKDKTSGVIDVSYIYDAKGNLVTVNYRLAPDELEYDKNGNVIKLSGEESTSYYYYDSQNKLINEKAESDFESCSFDKIVYKDLLILEKTYPYCEGNYAMRYVYEYSDSEKLLKILNYTKNCSSGLEELTKTEEYFYKDNSKLPFKMIKDNQEINFTYEYYK